MIVGDDDVCRRSVAGRPAGGARRLLLFFIILGLQQRHDVSNNKRRSNKKCTVGFVVLLYKNNNVLNCRWLSMQGVQKRTIFHVAVEGQPTESMDVPGRLR